MRTSCESGHVSALCPQMATKIIFMAHSCGTLTYCSKCTIWSRREPDFLGISGFRWRGRWGPMSVRSAQRFIAHQNLRGVGVRDCRQSDIEEWVLEGKSLHFVRWLKRQRVLPANVTIPVSSLTSSAQIGDPDDQLELARRLLHDPSVAGVEERVAGTLLLLYAQPLSRIVRLTIEDIAEDGGRMHLKLGENPLDVPPVLVDLLRQLPVHKPFGAARELADKQWLFPGKRAGRPRHAGSLMRALQPLGIPSRVSRNTALLHLANSAPPAIVANVLGIDTNTAQRWAETAGSSWTRYGPSRRQAANRGPVIEA